MKSPKNKELKVSKNLLIELIKTLKEHECPGDCSTDQRCLNESYGGNGCSITRVLKNLKHTGEKNETPSCRRPYSRGAARFCTKVV